MPCFPCGVVQQWRQFAVNATTDRLTTPAAPTSFSRSFHQRDTDVLQPQNRTLITEPEPNDDVVTSFAAGEKQQNSTSQQHSHKLQIFE